MPRNPSLEQLLDAELEVRELLLVEAQADDELATQCRKRGGGIPARCVPGWPPFLALHELRQVELRIRLLKEAINGR